MSSEVALASQVFPASQPHLNCSLDLKEQNQHNQLYKKKNFYTLCYTSMTHVLTLTTALQF